MFGSPRSEPEANKKGAYDMKSARKLLAAFLALCLVLDFVVPVPVRAAENSHTIVLSSTLNSDGSYSHTALYDGATVKEYDYIWHADPSTVHSEVSNSPAEYYTSTKPGSEAVYIAHDIYYYPELPPAALKDKTTTASRSGAITTPLRAIPATFFLPFPAGAACRPT